MGRLTTVFVEITLQSQAEDLLDAFEREVATVPDLLECHLMAGTADYLLKIMAEDTEDFARIHRQFLSPPAGRAADAVQSFALRTVVQDDGAGGLAAICEIRCSRRKLGPGPGSNGTSQAITPAQAGPGDPGSAGGCNRPRFPAHRPAACR